MGVERDEHEPARAAFIVGLALLEGRATATPDDPFEAARGALISAIAANDAEWSPRAAYVLGMALFERDDLTGARTYFAVAQRSGHREWSVGGLIGQAHLAARERRPDDAAMLFAPKAATNLGFVLANYLGDAPGARRAFEAALASGDPQQVQLAEQNLRAMDELERLRRAGVSSPSGEDGVDMSVPRGEGRVKRRWWFPGQQR